MQTEENEEKVEEKAPEFIRPEVLEVVRETSIALIAERGSIEINSADEYRGVAEYVKRCREAVTTIEDRFEAPIQKAHAAHKALIELRNEIIAPIKERILYGAGLLVQYDTEQERRRRFREEEQRKEQQRLQQQQEEERQRQIDSKTVEAQTAAENEQLAAAENVIELGERGVITKEQAKELSEEILSQPIVLQPEEVYVPPPPPPAPVVISKEVPKVKGLHYKEGNWTFEIIDAALVPRKYLQVNEQAIRAVVKGLKDAAKIPGVRVYQEERKAVVRGR